MSSTLSHKAAKSKPQLEKNRGFNRIKYHPKNTMRTKTGEPLLELRPPIARAHVAFMESNDGALFLSQCIYWQSTKKPHEYFFKSNAEWIDELMISDYQVRKFRKFLCDKGVLDHVGNKRANGHPTGHYRYDQRGCERLG